MREPLPRRDPYKVLQVDPEADQDVIQAAYRRLAQKHHPDLSRDPAAAKRMAELNAAWELLRDPARRAELDRRFAFDRARRAAMPPPARPATSASPGTAGGGRGGPPGRPVDEVSRDWTSGRSTVGGGYDASMRKADGEGAAGRPPGNPSGTVITFGRYAGWSLGEIGRTDVDYLEWLDRIPIGRQYREEIDAILRLAGRRRVAADQPDRQGLFRRR